jgi:hypothetical protein
MPSRRKLLSIGHSYVVSLNRRLGQRDRPFRSRGMGSNSDRTFFPIRGLATITPRN